MSEENTEITNNDAKELKVKDIEKLENTSVGSLLIGADAEIAETCLAISCQVVCVAGSCVGISCCTADSACVCTHECSAFSGDVCACTEDKTGCGVNSDRAAL